MTLILCLPTSVTDGENLRTSSAVIKAVLYSTRKLTGSVFTMLVVTMLLTHIVEQC